MATIRLTTNEYNIGALAGKYALKDMSNTGKFTNIITSLPVRTEVEVTDETNGEITLKQGSLLTIPNGFSATDGVTPVTEYLRVQEDITLNVGHTINDYSVDPVTSDKMFLVYNTETGALEIGDDTIYAYYEEDVYGDQVDENNRPIADYNGNTFVHVNFSQTCALPIGYFDDAWHWHAFTAIGFYGDLIWVDMGTEYLIPDGREEDYGLATNFVRISDIAYTRYADMINETAFGNDFEGFLFVDESGTAAIQNAYKSVVEYEVYDGSLYVSSENIIYDSNHNEWEVCKVSEVTVVDGKFDSVSNFNIYQAVDYSELSSTLTEMDETAFHKDDRDETVLGNNIFEGENTFENITINGGNINNVNVPGTITVTSTGGISFTDATFASVESTAELHNHLGLHGNTNTNKAGIAFGVDHAVRIYGDSDIGQIKVTLPETYDSSGNARTPSIIPAVTNLYEIGSSAYRFNNIYSTTFTGTAVQANWADLAEIYETDNEYEIGTLLRWGGEKDLTIASDGVCNAVVSEKPGLLLSANLKGQPVALVGKVRVRVFGKVNKHDAITLHETISGVGRVAKDNEVIVARALESNDFAGEKLVLCVVKFSL